MIILITNSIWFKADGGYLEGLIESKDGAKVSVKVGAEVTISGFHARDATQHMGMVRELTTADGTVYGLFGPQEAQDKR